MWIHILYLLTILFLILAFCVIMCSIYVIDRFINDSLAGFNTLRTTLANFKKEFLEIFFIKFKKNVFSTFYAVYLYDGKSLLLSIYDDELINILGLPQRLELKVLDKSGRLFISHKSLNINLVKNKNRILILRFFKQKDLILVILYFKSFLAKFICRSIISINKKRLSRIIPDLYLTLTVEKNKQKEIIENLRDFAFITVDNERRIISWNSGARMILGYVKEEMIGKDFLNLIKESEREKVSKLFDVVDKVDEEKMETTMIDSSTIPVSVELVVRKLLVNNIKMGYYLVVKDITKEVVWEESVKKQYVLNKRILDNIREGIILVDQNYRITFINEVIRKILYAETSYIGRNIIHVIPIQYGERIAKEINDIKECKKERISIDLKIDNRWYNVRFFPIKRAGGFIEEIIILFIDNDKFMEMQEKLREINKSLIEDLKTARLLQMSLIPQTLPVDEKIEFESIFVPSEEVGGDFYYVDVLTNRRGKKYYFSMISDVSGHGVGASMFTVLVKDMYNEYKITIENQDEIDVSEFISRLNKKIINLNIGDIKFLTLFVLFFDFERERAYFSSAGHPHAMIFGENFPLQYIGVKNSPPVGIIEDFDYEVGEVKIMPGQKFFIFSDGIIEFFDDNIARLENFILKNRSLHIKEIKEKFDEIIEKKRKEENFHYDDVTCILAQIKK